MPSAKLDFFWEGLNFFNFTYTSSQGGAPKVEPAWKRPRAPKLPPREQKALPPGSTPRPAARPNINATRFQPYSNNKENIPRITDVTDTEDTPETEPVKSKPIRNAPKKNPPKLKDISGNKVKSAPKAANSLVNGVK